jgi:7-cyano-7-deazaguanine reductase
MATTPTKELETFPNPNPERDYEISFEAPEFTCLCPMTAQPDFATIRIRYVPDQKCVELKSLKLYLWSFREETIFGEGLAARIAADVAEATESPRVEVTLRQAVRGGITITARAEIGSAETG